MRIKKIQARNFSEALANVKKELGEDAIIISSEEKKGAKPYVEVTAAVDYDIEPCVNSNYSPQSSTSNSDILEMKNEIRSLRESIDIMRNSGCELTLPAERKRMFYFLRERSIKDEYALSLVERAKEIEELETLISEDMSSSRLFNTP